MFFGLCNSPSTFQAFMNKIFEKEIAEGWMIIYMDDILIFSTKILIHQSCTKQAIEILLANHLFLRPAKCTLDVSEIEYLGMIICHGEIAMDPAKVKGILEWPQPKNLTEVRSFLGFCNFYQTFIAQYSTIAHPLIDLTKKDTPFSWTEAQSSAFKSLRSSFASSPVLKNPDPSRQFAIASDASLVATGAVMTWLGQDVTKKIVLRLKCEEQLKNSSKDELRGTGVQGGKPSKIQVKNYNKMCNIL
jgi:hypothetical protein